MRALSAVVPLAVLMGCTCLQVWAQLSDNERPTQRSIGELTAGQTVTIDAVNGSDDAVIVCSSGQQISILNAFMSSYLVFIDNPNEMQFFVHQNETKITEHFKSIGWTQPVIKWFDSSVVTKHMISSFTRQCIGIVAHKSFKLQLSIKSWFDS